MINFLNRKFFPFFFTLFLYFISFCALGLDTFSLALKSLTFPVVGEQERETLESEFVVTGESDNCTTLDIAIWYPLQVVLLLLLFFLLLVLIFIILSLWHQSVPNSIHLCLATRIVCRYSIPLASKCAHIYPSSLATRVVCLIVVINLSNKDEPGGSKHR